MQFNKREYQEWFEEHLGEVESLNMSGDNSILRHQPKVLKFKWWIFALIAGILVCGLVSYFTYTVVPWLSNLLLNLSAGILASLILLIFTNLKDKNINYANDAIPLLEKRMEQFNNALFDHNVDLQISRQRGDIDEYFGFHKLLSNTQCVITGFIEYLNEVSRYKPDYLRECGENKKIFFNTGTEYANLVYKLYNEKDVKLFDKIEKLEMDLYAQSMYMIAVLRNYIEDLNLRHYNIKYSKKFELKSESNWESFREKLIEKEKKNGKTKNAK